MRRALVVLAALALAAPARAEFDYLTCLQNAPAAEKSVCQACMMAIEATCPGCDENSTGALCTLCDDLADNLEMLATRFMGVNCQIGCSTPCSTAFCADCPVRPAGQFDPNFVANNATAACAAALVAGCPAYAMGPPPPPPPV
jgi:hypothetical protein